MVDVLLARGADPNIRDNDPRTGEMPDGDNAMPLHFAAEQGHLGIVRRLVEHSADPTRRNAQGLTAADIADKRGLDAVARLLRSHGGERP